MIRMDVGVIVTDVGVSLVLRISSNMMGRALGPNSVVFFRNVVVEGRGINKNGIVLDAVIVIVYLGYAWADVDLVGGRVLSVTGKHLQVFVESTIGEEINQLAMEVGVGEGNAIHAQQGHLEIGDNTVL